MCGTKSTTQNTPFFKPLVVSRPRRLLPSRPPSKSLPSFLSRCLLASRNTSSTVSSNRPRLYRCSRISPRVLPRLQFVPLSSAPSLSSCKCALLLSRGPRRLSTPLCNRFPARPSDPHSRLLSPISLPRTRESPA